MSGPETAPKKPPKTGPAAQLLPVIPCPGCPKIFTSDGSLRTHLRRKHTMDRKMLPFTPRIQRKPKPPPVEPNTHDTGPSTAELSTLEHPLWFPQAPNPVLNHGQKGGQEDILSLPNTHPFTYLPAQQPFIPVRSKSTSNVYHRPSFPRCQSPSRPQNDIMVQPGRHSLPNLCREGYSYTSPIATSPTLADLIQNFMGVSEQPETQYSWGYSNEIENCYGSTMGHAEGRPQHLQHSPHLQIPLRREQHDMAHENCASQFEQGMEDINGARQSWFPARAKSQSQKLDMSVSEIRSLWQPRAVWSTMTGRRRSPIKTLWNTARLIESDTEGLAKEREAVLLPSKLVRSRSENSSFSNQLDDIVQNIMELPGPELGQGFRSASFEAVLLSCRSSVF